MSRNRKIYIGLFISVILLILVTYKSVNTLQVHRNINSDIADDSMQVANEIEELIEYELHTEDNDVLDLYVDKYLAYDKEEYSKEEKMLIIHTSSMIRDYYIGFYDGLESNKQEFQRDKNTLINTLKTGEK